MPETPTQIPVRHREGDARDLTLLDLNARFMRHEQFQRLVKNIIRDGHLASTPLVYVHSGRPEYEELPAGTREVLSGNHRVKATIEAEVFGIHWLEIDGEKYPLSRAERTAKALSHNAIVGEDDPAILRQMYDVIDDLELRAYTGLDDKALELLGDVDIEGLAEAGLAYQTWTFMFLPEEADAITAAFEQARSAIASGAQVHLAALPDYERLITAMFQAGRSHDLHNTAGQLRLVLGVFQAHATDLADGWYDPEDGTARHKEWVPILGVLGTDNIPAPAAAVIKRAVDKAVGRGDVSPEARWQLLEFWAADYLANT